MKFQMRELIGTVADTARLGTDATAGGRLTDKDAGKLLTFAGDSRYDLAVVGAEIEGRVVSVDTATSDGYSTGAVQKDGRMVVIFDGLQATPGVGAIAVKDYVVVGTPVVKGTAQSDNGPKVCKATDQTAAKNSPFAWRVVSIITGTTAVGSIGCIERVA
jgi:hypothetical protein